jgi:phosphoribosylaminoimidazole (AIR) synthetase
MKEIVSYDDESKEKFHSKGKSFLRKVAKLLNLSPTEYDVRSCKGGCAVAGEVILHTTKFYVNISGDGFSYTRTCNGMKDYTGGSNHAIPEVAMVSPEKFVEFIKLRFKGLV